MLVSNSSRPDARLHQAVPDAGQGHSQSARLTRPVPLSAARGADSEIPAHFTVISAISHGSLATAYRTLRAAQAEANILSGLGMPAALAAYSEVFETE